MCRQVVFASLLLLGIGPLAGCGQKGPLYLPTRPAAPVAPTAAPAASVAAPARAATAAAPASATSRS